MKQLIFAGSYQSDRSIFLLSLDLNTGKMEKIGSFSGVDCPSYVIVSRTGTRLYAVSERMNGGNVHAFSLGEDGNLTHLNQLPTSGALACHLALNPEENRLAAANYLSGTVDLFRLNPDGSLAERCDTVQQQGSGPDTLRQEGPHAHFVAFRGSRLLSVDLGADRVFFWDTAGDRLRPAGQAVIPGGEGPRHLAFSPDRPELCYGVCEMGLGIYPLKLTESGAEVLGRRPVAPEGVHAGAAAVRCSSDGRFVYTSARAYPRSRGEDTLACLPVLPEDGSLGVPVFYRLPGAQPRDIGLFGSFLAAACQGDGQVVSIPRNPETGALGRPADRLDIPGVCCLAPWKQVDGLS